ncbi:MAG: alpha/beta fold hydrolase, partial [Phycisphaerales bacterium]
NTKLLAALTIGLSLFAGVAHGGDLARRGTIGLGVQPAGVGVKVAVLRPGGPADRAGLKVGDVIQSINGTAVRSQPDVAEAIRVIPGGSVAALAFTRDGNPQTLQVTLDTTPSETIEGSKVTYSSVTVPDGYQLRTIISEPNASPLAAGGKSPAFMFVQGIYCASLDRPQAPDAVDTRLVHAMAKAGYVTLRVDKPGLGDSQGPPCGEIGFKAELEGYKAALRQLKSLPTVDPERVYVFGHSMGGVMMPYLLQDTPVRGAIVYGTLARTWFEYQLENTRRQMSLGGASEGDIAEALQAEAKSSAMILVEKKTMGDVWERYPELKQESPMLDATHMSSRHMSFYHELQDLNLARAWEQVTTRVLAIHGDYDWVTTGADHDLIASIVNAKSPGFATSVALPKADHAFTLHESLKASLAAMGQGTWDGSLPKLVLEWIDTQEGRAQAVPAAPEAPTIAKAGAAAQPKGAPPATSKSEHAQADTTPKWTKLKTERYPGKQDDIFFVSPTVGWYANGAGKIFKTTDGGTTWVVKLQQPGTYFRCLAFSDDKVGFAGNIDTRYFPNVTDAVPLYQTADGGETWSPVTTIEGAPVVGLCALEVVRTPFVNAGNLDHKTRIVGVGRVGGPTAAIYSDDLGKTWQRMTLPASCAMAFDVHFFDNTHGIIASATSADVQASKALILATDDGGATWREVYTGPRTFEITWKISFPTRDVGFLTIQSYNPDPAASKRYLAKTTDGGKTWSEIPLVDDAKVREFGIAFIDENHGWVGAMPHGFATTDGGATWTNVDFGNAVNKIRVLREQGATYLHAIGVDVYTLKLDQPAK